MFLASGYKIMSLVLVESVACIVPKRPGRKIRGLRWRRLDKASI